MLYIEDNSDNLELIRLALKKIPQINFLSAPDARSGIELAIAQHPNLILMDIQLPGMDGIKALEHLKNNDTTCAIPVVALSANAMASDVQNAMKMGFAAYVTKPIRIENFICVIEKILKN